MDSEPPRKRAVMRRAGAVLLVGLLGACSSSARPVAPPEDPSSELGEPIDQEGEAPEPEGPVETAPAATLGELLSASHTLDGVRVDSQELLDIDRYIEDVLLPAELGRNASLVVADELRVAVEIRLESGEPTDVTVVGDQAIISIGSESLTGGAALDAELAHGVALLIAEITGAEAPEETWNALQELISVRHTLYGEEILDELPLLNLNDYVAEDSIPEALGDNARLFVEQGIVITVEIQLDSDLPIAVSLEDNQVSILIAARDVVSDTNMDRILEESFDVVLADLS